MRDLVDSVVASASGPSTAVRGGNVDLEDQEAMANSPPVIKLLQYILFQAIRLSDFFVIRGIVIVIILGIAGATFLLDVLYPLLDPRIKVRNS